MQPRRHALAAACSMVDAGARFPPVASIRRYARPRQNRGSGLTPYHTRMCPRLFFEAVANSGPGQGGWNSSLVDNIIRPAAYFFLDRRGSAVVLMVRMFAFEVEKALHLISRLRSRRHTANWRPCYLV